MSYFLYTTPEISLDPRTLDVSKIILDPVVNMPTPIDRALQSRNLFLGFAGLVALASISSIFGGDIFPAEKDPTGDPQSWTDEELRRWLKNVSH